jgi:tetratricopeptide (TPR) repeat protein
VKDSTEDLSISLDELLSLTPMHAQPPATAIPAEGDLTLQGQRHRKQQLEIEVGVHHKAGRIAEAERLLNEILAIDPKDAKALYELGQLARDAGEIARAERYMRRALDSDPDYFEIYQAFGDMHFVARHVLSAIEIYERGLKRAPNRLPMLGALMQARLVQRIPHVVAEVAERILRIDEDHIEAICYLAWADLMRGGDLERSRANIAQLLAQHGERPAAVTIAFEIARRSGRRDEMDNLRSRLDALINVDWTSVRLAADLFVTLNQFDRAGELVKQFLDHNPDSESALKYLASVLFQEGDFRAGHRILEQVLAMGHDFATLSMVYGLNSFRLGDVETFFRQHYTRWQRDGSEKMWELPAPDWTGGSVSGGKLLIYCEQGVGDHVMYATCFADLAKHARDVIIETLPRIAPLFQRSFPQYQVVTRTQLPPDWSVETIAAKAPAADLPMLIGGDIEHLPGKAGFLVPDAALMTKLRERYRARFPGKRIIGISWRSGNRDSAAFRSLDLPYWKQLLDQPDCAFVSLQYGDIARDLEELKEQLGDEVRDRVYWDREINPLGNMDPFAAQIAAVDLVISVDNSTVHFAGGLGKPCWVMVPINTDWRWQLDRSDTAWYESLELFRQDKASGWDGVIERIVARLAALDAETLTTADWRHYFRSATVLAKAQRYGEAEGYWRLLLAAGHHKPEALQGIGLSALAAGQAADAVAILFRAMELAPEDTSIKADLAWALANAGEGGRGLALARQLTRDHPESTAAQTASGRILWKLARADEAGNHFARVLRKEPTDVPSRMALAALQATEGEWDLSLTNYKRVLELQPGNALAHTAFAEIELRQENWAAAWPEFGWRFGTWPGTLPHHFSTIDADRLPKRWNGGSLKKSRIFLRAERSVLEQLLFADLLSTVEKESRHVLIECDPRVGGLLAASFPGISVKPAGTTKESDLSEQAIEVASSLGDLMARYRGRSAEFPVRSRPCLTLDPQRVAALRAEYQACFPGRPLVGLSWRHTGNDAAGSTALASWLPLIDRSELGIVAVHPGAADAELAHFAAETGRNLIFDRRIDLAQDLVPFCIQMAACDLVVAVDDLAACIAQMLGKPLVKLARPVDHWWWGCQDGGSIWFPGARLVRAREPVSAIAAVVDLAVAGAAKK